jgi:hypothetical protein
MACCCLYRTTGRSVIVDPIEDPIKPKPKPGGRDPIIPDPPDGGIEPVVPTPPPPPDTPPPIQIPVCIICYPLIYVQPGCNIVRVQECGSGGIVIP